jgi:hypothetical protein
MNGPEPARTGETMFSTLRQTFGGDEALVNVQTVAPFRKCRRPLRAACDRCRAKKVVHDNTVSAPFGAQTASFNR